MNETLVNIVAVVQARMNSTRLPNKMFAELSGKPLIWHVIDRLKKSKKITSILLATTSNPADDVLEKWCRENGVAVFRGDETNVLARFYHAAKIVEADFIVRITADDPFKDPMIIDEVIGMVLSNHLDFGYNNNPPTFPEGIDTEVFTMGALERAQMESNDSFEREHVTQYFYRHPNDFRQMNWAYGENISWIRWTIDREEDLRMARAVYDALYRPGKIFLMDDILSFLKKHPEIAQINQNVERSAMYIKK